MKGFLTLILFLLPALLVAQEAKPAVPAADTKVEADRLTRKQKRELGLLPAQVLINAKQMVKDGVITKDMTAKEMAFSYCAEVSGMPEYSASWDGVRAGTYGIDWDGLIAFAEKLFEFLMKFIPLFFV